MPGRTLVESLLVLPAEPTPDDLLDAFVEHCAATGIEMYDHQEEAILELLGGNHVILDTPTGSGKSLVGLAAQFAALARNQVTFYTAPIKALVSEKFFWLCQQLGAENVGMLTGDASVNADAPVICCTAEILANMALRDGDAADADQVVIDEFHYYADPQRGWAWQVPLLELTRVQFLLMSATLGPTQRFANDLQRRTGRACSIVRRTERPVPLEHSYRETPLHETVAEIVTRGLAPAYVVHFTQNDAVDHAQALMSTEVCTRPEKDAIKAAIGGFRFDQGFGTDLRRYVSHGVGVHHAGMLPKYRRLVERLAQEGALKVICGTDTLGVGINVPIRTVLFSQLCKYDGQSTRLLSVREFRQIAGRAGRAGFDEQGWVWCQAPVHEIENKRAEEAAVNDPKKRKKLVKRKPPEFGYKPWSAATFERLSTADPEPLVSTMTVNHAMLVQLLERRGDGCRAALSLLRSSHETAGAKRKLAKQGISMYRSLLEAGIVERLAIPDADGRRVRLNLDLQADFRLNQPLSPWVLHAVSTLERERDSPDYAPAVLTIVESTLENPAPVLARQTERARGEAVARMKAEGMQYEERMELLADVSFPRPNEDFIYETFNEWRPRHPWVDENVRPKSVAREMFERAMTFREYVADYRLARSEGVLLRYLTDAYKALVQTVPDSAYTDDLDDLAEWLGVTVRSVDSSLLDEWEALRNPAPELATAAGLATSGPAGKLGSFDEQPPDITASHRAFRVLVRNQVFNWVQWLARREYHRFATVDRVSGDEPWGIDRVAAAMRPYWDEHREIRTDAAARGPRWFDFPGPGGFVKQVLIESDDDGGADGGTDSVGGDWHIMAEVDLEASRTEARAVVRLVSIGPIGAIGAPENPYSAIDA